MNVIGGLEHVPYKDRRRELCLVKRWRRLCGDPMKGRKFIRICSDRTSSNGWELREKI